MFQTTETVEAIVTQLLEKQRTARMTGSLDCSDPDSTCLDNKSCIHQVRIQNPDFTWDQIISFQAVKSEAPSTTSSRPRGGRGSMMHHRHGAMGENNNQVGGALSQDPAYN